MKRQKLKEIMEAYKPKLLPLDVLMMSMSINQQKAKALAQGYMMNKNIVFEKYRTKVIKEELEELEWQCYMESVGFNWEIYDDWDFDWSMYD